MSSAFTLPNLAVSRVDIARLTREVESLEEHLHQAGLRQTGEASTKLPKTSRTLDELAVANKLNLLEAEARKKLINSLRIISQKAPVVHMSFSVDPSAAFMQKMIIWWRTNIDPYLLIETGLQPNIAVGCIVRTPNHQYNFSLREQLLSQRDQLIKMLEVPAAV
jgi:hypothetical protein